MRKPALTLVLSAAALALSGSALAAPGAAPGDAPHRGFHHGPTSRADAQSRTDALFAKLDVNGDGVLDPKDREARQAEHFAKLDTDHNGSLSPQEFAAGGPGHGGPRAEFAGKGPGPDAPPPGDAEAHGPRPMRMHGMRGPGMMMKAGMIAREADTNHDGAVSKAEFEAFTLAHFDEADTNHDGTLSKAERAAAWKDRREDRGGEHRGAWRRHGADDAGDANDAPGPAGPDSE